MPCSSGTPTALLGGLPNTHAHGTNKVKISFRTHTHDIHPTPPQPHHTTTRLTLKIYTRRTLKVAVLKKKKKKNEKRNETKHVCITSALCIPRELCHIYTRMCVCVCVSIIIITHTWFLLKYLFNPPHHIPLYTGEKHGMCTNPRAGKNKNTWESEARSQIWRECGGVKWKKAYILPFLTWQIGIMQIRTFFIAASVYTAKCNKRIKCWQKKIFMPPSSRAEHNKRMCAALRHKRWTQNKR